VLGDEGSTSLSNGTAMHSSECIDYNIPECPKERVESWVNTMNAIITSVKISELHLTTLRTREMSITNMQAKIEATSASAKIEKAQVIDAYKAICSSTPCDSVEDPVSFLEAQQAAISDAEARITTIKKAHDNDRSDLEAQVANATKDKAAADAKMQESNIGVANAKKRKAEIEEEGGFSLGFALGRTRCSNSEGDLKKKMKT
jgi:hypothetical protein